MKGMYPIAGISKQGFHQWLDRYLKALDEQQQLYFLVEEIRRDHPKLSARQMYFMLQPKTMGRDHFEKFCYENGFKVEQKRKFYKTTDSRGVKRFDNLLLKLDELTGINQLWVSDITYYRITERFYYLTFITDIFNREIVGYKASESLLTTQTTIPALKMAIRKRNLKKAHHLILHSDGGGQYFSHEFTALTHDFNIQNSMGKTAYENPHAERVNGTIKNEYLHEYNPHDFQELVSLLNKAVRMYNQFRPHSSLDRHTPAEFRMLADKGLLTKIWVINKKKKVTKKEKVNINIK